MKHTIKYILIFFSYFLFNALVVSVLSLLGFNFSTQSILFKNIYLFSIDLIYLFLLFFLVKNDFKDDFNNFKEKGIELIIKFFPIYILGLILMGISNSIIINITGIQLSANEESVREMIKIYPFYMFFSSVIYAPFVEEIIFRKSIRESIKDNLLFIITSGLIFGLVHVINNGNESLNEILMGIPYIIMGIDFAYIYYKSKNIFTTMVLHSLHNFVLIIIQFIGG